MLRLVKVCRPAKAFIFYSGHPDVCTAIIITIIIIIIIIIITNISIALTQIILSALQSPTYKIKIDTLNKQMKRTD